MGSALKIRDDLTPLELRRWARVESYGRAAARAYGIANALEEMPRADAARLAGMDRQTLRDAVVRYNAKGLEGLHDRPKGYSPRRLTDTISADYSLRPSELASTLALLVEARQPVVVWGAPGCAKSQIAQQVAAQAGREYVDVRALLLDPVDRRRAR